LRSGLADDGRWLKPDARQQLQAWISQRPRMATLVEYRRRLAAVLDARSQDAGDTLHALQDWCREAEATGIRALQEFSARLKGYSLQPTRA
jgi:stearoyl-CoA desaturase (delta-9 desaturase)